MALKRLCLTTSLHLPSSNPKPKSTIPPFHCSSLLQFSPSFTFKPLRCLSPSSSAPPSPLFLPYLEDQSESETEYPEGEDAEDPEIEDPLFKFFKSRSETASPDPGKQGRNLKQRNRRTSWRLADSFEDDPDEFDAKIDGEDEDLGVLSSNSVSVNGVLGEILKLARDVPANCTLGELLGPYVGRIGEEECVWLLGLLGEEGLVVGCLYFFEWMGAQEPPLVSPRAYSAVFTVLGRAGLGEELMVSFRNLPAKKQFRDVRVYNSAISGLSFAGRFDEAWEVYEAMETNNIKPDHVTCSILLTVMRRSGRNAKDAWDFFERMKGKGVKWSLEVSGSLIKCFCDEGLTKEALIILSDMEKKGLPSNAIIYNTIMDAYSKANRIEEAEGLFVEMKEKGVKPTSATYNILMNAYCRRMQPEIIEDLLLEMQESGLEPNVKSYTCLISAYGRHKDMSDKAADAFLRMKKVGVKPSSHSYTALVHAYSVGGWHEKAYSAFESMKREGIRPSIETYTALLDAYRRAGDTEKLMEVWKLMIHDKVEGTHVTFNTLLDGFAKQGHYDEARDVIFEFGRIGFSPTVMTYNMLINAYARGMQHSKLPQLLKEMSALNLKPDSVTYSTMIYAYLRVRDFKRAFYYHKQMVKSKQLPDAKSYQKMRALLDAKAKQLNKNDKSAILGIVRSHMGIKKPKGKKDEFWKEKRRLYRTFAYKADSNE
ncbi:hypothetical protein Scep_018024 [Stephania cephalantha]|uniref:Pentatricopeptide repeat-containing protein n=1 Tax=Stephania cephalantha TaxID=152367 RepID=A0AAP0IQN4_9MAGN